MNLGTLIVGPREHVVAVADLDDSAAAELGPLLRDTTRVVEALCQPEQTYVCLWSHGASARKHLHIAVQPVTAAVVARYDGLRSEKLQARMMASGDEPDAAAVQQFCDQARELFGTIGGAPRPPPLAGGRTCASGGTESTREEINAQARPRDLI